MVNNFMIQYFDIFSVFLELFGAGLPRRLKRTRICHSYLSVVISMWQRYRVVADKDVKCFEVHNFVNRYKL